MNNPIFEAVDSYIENLLAPQDDVLTAVIQTLSDQQLPPQSISPIQGKFLQVMARLCGAKKILEIGTFGGYSTIWLARALPENGQLVTIEADPAYASLAQEHIRRAGVADKVDIWVGKALAVLPQLVQNQEGPFDLVFIDADKPPYTEYFQYALRLSRPGTLIIADNVIREGKVLESDSPDEKVLGVQRFNQLLADTPQVNAIILQMVGIKAHDGMALAVVNRV